jgi:NADH-quinone oxidoreductase subunit H
MLSDYFPKEKLPAALGVFSMGIYVGNGAALVLGGAVTAAAISLGVVHTALLGDVKPWQLVFFVAGLAELQRPPFDMPVADAEIIFGPYTEYSGIRFALFLLAEYAGIVVLCALTAVLFLCGWRGPFANDVLGPVWLLAKIFLLAFVVIWLRVSNPRLRADQLQRLAWQVLVPVTLVQLALTGVVRVVMS